MFRPFLAAPGYSSGTLTPGIMIPVTLTWASFAWAPFVQERQDMWWGETEGTGNGETSHFWCRAPGRAWRMRMSRQGQFLWWGTERIFSGWIMMWEWEESQMTVILNAIVKDFWGSSEEVQGFFCRKVGDESVLEVGYQILGPNSYTSSLYHSWSCFSLSSVILGRSSQPIPIPLLLPPGNRCRDTLMAWE